MNNDIVKRLRKWPEREYGALRGQAADEIERLRVMAWDWQMRHDDVAADRDRLRAALERIAEYTGEGPATTPWREIVREIAGTARAALASTAETGSVALPDNAACTRYRQHLGEGEVWCECPSGWCAAGDPDSHAHCPHCGQWHDLKLGC